MQRGVIATGAGDCRHAHFLLRQKLNPESEGFVLTPSFQSSHHHEIKILCNCAGADRGGGYLTAILRINLYMGRGWAIFQLGSLQVKKVPDHVHPRRSWSTSQGRTWWGPPTGSSLAWSRSWFPRAILIAKHVVLHMLYVWKIPEISLSKSDDIFMWKHERLFEYQ